MRVALAVLARPAHRAPVHPPGHRAARPDPSRRRDRPRTATASRRLRRRARAAGALHRTAVQPLRGSAGRLRRRIRLLHRHRPARGHVPADDVPRQAATIGYSARVANALFVAANPGGPEADVPLRRVPEVRRGPLGAPGAWRPGPTDDEFADMARTQAFPPKSRPIEERRIRRRHEDHGRHQLRVPLEIDPVDTGTPTVYDLNTGEKLDIYDNDWLSKLMAS